MSPPPSAACGPVSAEHADAVVTHALRRLLRCESPQQAVEVLIGAVEDLGCRVEEPTRSGEGQLPVDLSLGIGDPLVPAGDGSVLDIAAPFVGQLVEDAHVTVDRLRLQDHLAASASVDPLTGLANRRAVMRVLARLEVGDHIAVLDVDGFKQVNDDHGHDIGDAVLRLFGGALQGVVRAADTAGRMGGDEFVVLMLRSDQAGAAELLARLREAWEQTRPLPVTFSAGLAAVDERGPRQALLRADDALYAAKARGRDRMELDPELGGT